MFGGQEYPEMREENDRSRKLGLSHCHGRAVGRKFFLRAYQEDCASIYFHNVPFEASSSVPP